MPTAALALDLLLTPALAATLLALAWIDRREGRLPDALTLPLAAAGLALAAVRAGGAPWPEVAGALGGLLAFAALGEAHHRLRGTEGLGLGDAKLLGAAGAWLGWRPLPLLVLLASVAALAWVLLRRRGGPLGAGGPGGARGLAFGPWLALAFMALWLLRLARGGS